MQDDLIRRMTSITGRYGRDRPVGRVAAANGSILQVSGLPRQVALGDLVEINRGASVALGEVIALAEGSATVLAEGGADGVGIKQRVVHRGPLCIFPDSSWLGRVIDPFGRPLDGRALLPGRDARPVFGTGPAKADRRGFGPRLETGMRIFNTVLPIARGQRIGLFAGSGVGKTSLLGSFAARVAADVVVLALVGERSREIGEGVRQLMRAGLKNRLIVVAAPSDASPVARRFCAEAAMTVAEHFRDAGQHVLFLADSITRMAEAHREIASHLRERPSFSGYPSSVVPRLAALIERAGPGGTSQADITAIMSVLVPGSDMEGPIADLMRGSLDGHVLLDRGIAERGRFPPLDVARSVSRALPHVATDWENLVVSHARKAYGRYAESETVIRSGLYESGNDAELDAVISAWPALDAFAAEIEPENSGQSFLKLREILIAMGAEISEPDPIAADASLA